ncbi:MAG: LysR family transcriptional regulator [Rhodocyclaceae bacterium]
MAPIRFDWQDLDLLLAAAETGSIAGAAERCHTVPSAASKRLSDLESRFGVTLLERARRGVTLTAAGEALARRARPLIDQARQLQLDMADYARGVEGHVRLFANISAIVEFLPAILAAFAERHPAIRVQLEEDVSRGVLRAVAERRADIGIVSERSHIEGVQFHAFLSDHLQLVVPPGHVLAGRPTARFADALDYPCIGLQTHSSLHAQLVRAAAELGREYPQRIQVTSFDAVCAMVAAGLGVGVVPAAATRAYVAALGLTGVELDEPWAARQLYLVVRTEPLAAATQRLFEHLDGMRRART